MKSYSTINQPPGIKEPVKEKNAPYNWVVLMLIFLGYIVFAMLS